VRDAVSKTADSGQEVIMNLKRLVCLSAEVDAFSRPAPVPAMPETLLLATFSRLRIG
jgi:hypothetical protein